MPNMKWLALMLLIITLNIIMMTFLLRSNLRGNQGMSIMTSGKIVRDQFVSTLKTYLVPQEPAFTGTVAIDLTTSDQKVNIVLSVAKDFRKPFIFPPQANLVQVRTPLGHFVSEPSNPESEMTKTNHENTIEPEVTMHGGRVKREISTTDADISTNHDTTTLSVARISREALASVPLTYLVPEVTSPTGRIARGLPTKNFKTNTKQKTTILPPIPRVVRKSLKPTPRTTLKQEVTTPYSRETIVAQEKLNMDSEMTIAQETTNPVIARNVREALTSAPQTDLVHEVTRPHRRVTRDMSTSVLDMSIEQETTIPSITGIVREASTYSNLGQEVTILSGPVRELSTSGQPTGSEHQITNPSINRIGREAATPTSQTNPVQNVTTISYQTEREQETTVPSVTRIVREASTSDPMATQWPEVTSDLSDHVPSVLPSLNPMNIRDATTPLINKKGFIARFITETLSAVLEDFKHLKRRAMEGISTHSGAFTFPPPTDPEGTD